MLDDMSINIRKVRMTTAARANHPKRSRSSKRMRFAIIILNLARFESVGLLCRRRMMDRSSSDVVLLFVVDAAAAAAAVAAAVAAASIFGVATGGAFAQHLGAHE